MLEAGGFQPSDAHQERLQIQFAALFPHLAAARVTHRWGGLQSFTADGLPLIGRFDDELNLWGMAGFCGRGNCHANVGAEFLSARLTGVGNRIARDYAPLFDRLMAVDRPGARWGEWRSLW